MYQNLLLKLIKFIYKNDLDIILCFIGIKVNMDNKIIVWIFILYSILRFYTLQQFVIMFFINYITFTAIASNCMSFNYGSERNTIVVYIFISGLIFILITQVYAILIKVFSRKLVRPPRTSNLHLELIVKLMYFLDTLYYLVAKILAIIYPVIISLMIIVIFSSAYNSINLYYQDVSSEVGIFYANSEHRLTPINQAELEFNENSIIQLVKNDYMYFSSTTFYTIGYGDIIPKGTTAKMMVSMQMVISNVLGIGIFALYGALFYNFIFDRKIEDYKSESEVERISIV